MPNHLFVCSLILTTKKICQQADMLPIFLGILKCFSLGLQSKQKLLTNQQKKYKKDVIYSGALSLIAFRILFV